LSPALRGHSLPERTYSYGGYADSFFIRSDQWALWGENRPGRFRLFDVRRDPAHNHNVASRHPDVVNELYGTVVARAHGRLPFYG
ncbi:MAG: hypothetical protein ACJ76K_12560, partial [Solirubrobacteraceae bacterium]